MSSHKKFIKNVGFASIARIVNSLKGLILLPILTKTLGAEYYGTWAQILVTVSLLMPLALLQLEYAMTRFLTAEKDKNKISKGFSSIFATVLLSATMLSLSVFFFAEILAVTVFGGAGATCFIRISAFLILLSALDQIILQYFISFQQMKRYSGFVILQTLSEVSLIGYAALSGYGLIGAIISLLLVKTFIFIIAFLLVRSEIKITTPSFSIIPYLAFSLPLTPFTLSWWLVTSGDRYVIGYFLGTSSVGIYSASYTLGNMISLLYSPITLVLLPTITNLYENNKIREVKIYLEYIFKFFLMISIPSLLGLTIISNPLLRILTTPEFVRAYIVVPIVAFGALLYSLSNFFSDILILSKRTKIVSIVFGSSALLNLVMNIFLVPLIGIIGAAIATLITFAILFFILAFFSFKSLSFDWNPKFITKSIISSAIMGYVIWHINPIGVIDILISVVIGAVMYFGVLLLLKGFTKKEYAFLKEIASAAVKVPKNSWKM